MTALDRALKVAQKQNVMVLEFYRLFLHTRLLVPIMDTPVPADRIRGATRGRFKLRIKLLRKRRILPIFDLPERFKGAFKHPTQYVVLEGRAILSSLPPDIYISLNPGTPFAKMFLPKELAWLRSVLAGKPAKPVRPAR